MAALSACASAPAVDAIPVMHVSPSIDTAGGQYDRRAVAATTMCESRRNQMQRDLRAIDKKQSYMKLLWTGLGASFGLASTMYAITDKTPNASTVGLLSLGATATTVPAFFMEPHTVQRSSLERRLAAIDQAWQSLKTNTAKAVGFANGYHEACRNLYRQGASQALLVRVQCSVPQPWPGNAADTTLNPHMDAATAAFNNFRRAMSDYDTAIEELYHVCI